MKMDTQNWDILSNKWKIIIFPLKSMKQLHHAVILTSNSTHTAVYQYLISPFFYSRVSTHNKFNVCKWLAISIDLRGIYDGWLLANLHRTVSQLNNLFAFVLRESKSLSSIIKRSHSPLFCFFFTSPLFRK